MPRVPPPVLFGAVAAAALGGRALGVLPQGPPAPEWAAAAGVVLGVAAVTLAGASVRALAAFDGTGPVRRGPFGWSRHPMYLAMLGIVAAAALFTFEPALALAVPLLAVLLDRCVVRPEERELEAAFGDAYRDYARSVRRWL